MHIAELRLLNDATLLAGGAEYACAVGRGGIRHDKREGDLATPTGSFPLRCCYYRPDRLPAPTTELPVVALAPDDAWCDDPASPLYNQPVKLPFSAHHEKLWRADHQYDLIIPVGYNDGPVVAGLGSAIFIHIRREDGEGTEGCVALGQPDLLALLPRLSPQTVLTVPARA